MSLESPDQEKFNPSDPKYKSVTDLPSQHQTEFVDTETGFVDKKALEYFDQLKKEAEERTERINSQKILKLNKISPIDLAHEYALMENKNASEKEEELCDLLERAFVNIFNEEDSAEFVENIKNHTFESIISEDTSARIPAEALQMAINRIYKSQGLPEIKLISFPIGQHFNEKLVYPLAEKIISENQLGEGTIHITEFTGGNTIRKVASVFDKVINESSSQNTKAPSLFASIILGGSHLDTDLYSSKMIQKKIDLVEEKIKNMEKMEKSGTMSYYSAKTFLSTLLKRKEEKAKIRGFDIALYGGGGFDLFRHHVRPVNKVYRVSHGAIELKERILEPEMEHARKRILERVSDKIVELYNLKIHH